MKQLPLAVVALVGVVPAYLVGWVLWLIGTWASIVPSRPKEHALAVAMLAPLVVPALYLGWVFALRSRRPGQSQRRMIHFAIAAALGTVVSSFQLVSHSWWGAGERTNELLTAIAFALMLCVALAALVFDRDVEMSLRLLLLTFLAIVPVVSLGRLLAIGVAMTLYYGLRVIHGSAS